MSYLRAVKELAYTLDPECWVSYSGKPRGYKSAMDGRRTRTLLKAQELLPTPAPARCECCGQPVVARE